MDPLDHHLHARSWVPSEDQRSLVGGIVVCSTKVMVRLGAGLAEGLS